MYVKWSHERYSVIAKWVGWLDWHAKRRLGRKGGGAGAEGAAARV